MSKYKNHSINHIVIKTIIQTTTNSFLQKFFPFFPSCKLQMSHCSFNNYKYTTTIFQHQQFKIHKCSTTDYRISYSNISSHHHHLSNFQIPKYLLSLLPITYYLLYCYLFPSFLFPVSKGREDVDDHSPFMVC